MQGRLNRGSLAKKTLLPSHIQLVDFHNQNSLTGQT